jgi:peptidoglycan hydrolase FlgJ
MTDMSFVSLLPAGGYQPGSTQSKVPQPAATGPRDAKAWKQAQDFEQMFMEQTLGQLTQNLTGEGPLGDEGTGSDVWRSMLTQQYAKTITQAGGLGIAPSVYHELMRLQEKPHASG